MASLPFWYDQPDAWDTAILGGNTLPGLADVKVTKGRKLDVKQSPGTHGATLTDQGYKPAKVTITLTLHTAEQWAAFQAMAPSLEPPPGKAYSQPFDILHPSTSVRGVKSVQIEDIDGPDKGSIPGTKVVTIKCVQYFPPKAGATNTPKTSIAPQQNALTAPVAPTAPSSGGTPGP